MLRIVQTLAVGITTLSGILASPISRAAHPDDQGLAMQHVEVEVGLDRSAMTPGGSATLGIRFIIEDGWHLYWRNCGDSGMAISVTFEAPEGVHVGPLQWPAPERHVYGHGSVDYIYEHDVALLAEVTIDDRFDPGARIEIAASFEILACKEACVFGMGEREIVIDIAESTSMTIPKWMKKNQSQIPRHADLGEQIRWDGTDLLISVYGIEGINRVTFFPYLPAEPAPSDPLNDGSSETGHLRIAYPPEIIDAPRVAGVLEIDARMGKPYWIEIETTPLNQAKDEDRANTPIPALKQTPLQPTNDRSGD